MRNSTCITSDFELSHLLTGVVLIITRLGQEIVYVAISEWFMVSTLIES